MYSLKLEREVAISHQLKYHAGKCANLHGHNLLIKVDIKADKLIEGGSSDGMIVDFGDVKKIIDTLDHTHINSFAHTDELRNQPTAERLAHHLANLIYKSSGNESIRFVTVSVQEATGQSVSYTLEPQSQPHPQSQASLRRYYGDQY